MPICTENNAYSVCQNLTFIPFTVSDTWYDVDKVATYSLFEGSNEKMVLCVDIWKVFCSHRRVSLFQDGWPTCIATVAPVLLMTVEFVWCKMITSQQWVQWCRETCLKIMKAFLRSVGLIWCFPKWYGLRLLWNWLNMTPWNPRTRMDVFLWFIL